MRRERKTTTVQKKKRTGKTREERLMKVLLVNGSPHKEGIQVMQILGNNMAYFINCKNVATKMGIEMPKEPDFVFTNFIR